MTHKNNHEISIEGHIVDVLQRRIYDGTLHLQEGRIARIEEKISSDAPAALPYILPGFVDAHLHIESTLLTPEHYAPLAVAKGVLGAVADPHEIANVLGMEGVNYMIDNSKRARFHFHFAAPSCVPSTPFETAGAALGSEEVRRLLQRDEVCALAEMMNFPGLLAGDKEVWAKLQAANEAGKPIDGHAPGLGGEALQQYIAAGIGTEHECTTLKEAQEKLRKGMKIALREGSAACDFDTLMPLLALHDSNIMLCSDDKYPDELLQGYIDDMVRRAIVKGMPLWHVLQAACVTPVRHYRLKQGLLQTNDSADFIVVDNLMSLKILRAFIEGKEVYNAAEKTARPTTEEAAGEPWPNRFCAQPLQAAQLHLAPRGRKLKVMMAEEGSLYTACRTLEPRIEEGNVVSDPRRDILKLVVYNRYHEAAPAVAFVHGFGLKRGALASTIAHDSHNIIAVGCSDEEIVRAVNRLVALKGGIAVHDGITVHALPLPIAGLMSPDDGHTVAREHARLKQTARQMGCRFAAPFMTLAFMALPVIPELKLTDMGLFDGRTFAFTDLFE